jgi:L-asparaginase II
MRPGPLSVNIFRGKTQESRHLVDAVVVDSHGKVIESFGDCEQLVFPRSAIKMIQALPLLESGAAEKLKLSEKEIALACASHKGEPQHTEVVQVWLARLGLGEKDLECGSHWPSDEATKFAMICEGKKPCAFHNNCSGKHAGFLSTAVYLGEPTANYIQYDHPVQKNLRRVLSEISQYNYDHASWGVDGCGIPTYAVPLKVIAKAMAALLPEASADSLRKAAAKKILSAVSSEPSMISGTQGLCSRIVRISDGRAIAKTGAEGVYTALIPEKGIALALKVRDGASRASELAALYLIEKLGGLTSTEAENLRASTAAVIKNWVGLKVGHSVVSETQS